jgi:hypothetical protein
MIELTPKEIKFKERGPNSYQCTISGTDHEGNQYALRFTIRDYYLKEVDQAIKRLRPVTPPISPNPEEGNKR